MTGLDLIATALAAGAGAGAAEATSQAVRDSFGGLRAVLRRRLAGRGEQAIVALNAEHTDAGVWHARLDADLAACGADRDEHVLAAARDLLEQVGRGVGGHQVTVYNGQGLLVGDHSTQHNTFN